MQKRMRFGGPITQPVVVTGYFAWVLFFDG
jgi:hypothetical protein